MVVKTFVRRGLAVLLALFGIYFGVVYLYSEKYPFHLNPFAATSAIVPFSNSAENRDKSSDMYVTGWQGPRDQPEALMKHVQAEMRIVNKPINNKLNDDNNDDEPNDDNNNKEENKNEKKSESEPPKTVVSVSEKKKSPEEESEKHRVEEKKPEEESEKHKVEEKKREEFEKQNVEKQKPEESEKHEVEEKKKPEDQPKENENVQGKKPDSSTNEQQVETPRETPKEEHQKQGVEYSSTTPAAKSDPPPKPVSQAHDWGKDPYKETQSFKTLDGSSMFLYSAFWDRHNDIRVFGLLERVHYHPNITCKVWMSNPPSSEETPSTAAGVSLVNMPEHHDKMYTAGYVLCHLPPNTYKLNPKVVTLSVHRGPNSTHVALPIHQKQNWKSEFTMCIAPLFNAYNSAGTIIEMIEFNRLLGATKFFFYNYSIGDSVMEVLKHYQHKGLVEIMNWPLPTRSMTAKERGLFFSIHYYGQLTAMNDCVYRNRYQSDYVVLTDIDEFIVPNKTTNMTTWRHLIAERKKVNPKFTVFWVKNLFYRKKWAKKEDEVYFNATGKDYKSVVLSHLYREDVLYNYGVKSKNIVDPLGVGAVGIHNIWEKAGLRDTVPDHQASVHHFRSRYWPGDTQKRIFDDHVKKRYGDALTRNVLKSMEDMKEKKKYR